MNYFQELAAKYDAWFATPHGQYVQRFEREVVMDMASLSPDMYVADIGCGTGLYTAEFCRAGARVVGVDISPEMLAIAADRTKEYGDKVSFLESDAAAIPIADDSFDMVYSITAMEFFEKPRDCLLEMYRVLRPGGRLVVATLNSLSPWSLQRRVKAIIKPTIFTPTRFYSIYDLQALFAPYAITSWRGCIFVPPFAPKKLLAEPDAFERWGQKYIPMLGTFIAAIIEKPNKKTEA